MQNMDEMMEYFEQEEGTNVKEFLFKILSKWYWFALFGFIGVVGGYMISKYTLPTYQVSSTVLVNEDSKGMGVENFFDGLDFGGKTNIENHILILKSYSLNRQTLANLDWRVSWMKKRLFKNVCMYSNTPFNVKDIDGDNITSLPLIIKPINEKEYKVSVNGTRNINGDAVNVSFTEKGTFGEPFENKYFHFTIKNNGGIEEGAEYIMTFNNLDMMALGYQKKLNVSLAQKKADVVNLSLEGSNPSRDVDYLNELTRVYIQFGLKEKNRTAENTVKFIDVQLAGIVDTLRDAGRSFTDFRSRNRVVDLGQEAGIVMQKLEELESQKAMAEMRLTYYSNLSNYMGDANKMKQVVAPSVMGIVDAGLNALVLKLGELYSKREVMSYSAQDRNPRIMMLDGEIVHVRKSLSENLKNLVSNSRIEMEGLNKRLSKVNKQLSGLPRTEQEMINIKRRFDLNNELYTFLLKKRAEAAISRASNISDSQVLDPARFKTAKKVGPKSMTNILVGLILGLGFPFMVIVIGDYFNDTIQNKDQVEKDTKLPIVGSIAHNQYEQELPVFDHPRSGISESFRGLRTNLQYLLTDDNQKVIAIHSTSPGEGKSFASVNLATIIAMNNKKVLLVGCDMRRPRLHQMFNKSNDVGLSTYLINRNSFDEVVIPTGHKNLSVTVAGPVPPNPAELLEHPAFAEFIEKARDKFDYIVMDNAPSAMVTDGVLAGRFADANLFMLRQKYSNRDHVKFIDDLSHRGALKQVALIINDVEYAGYGYGKSYNSYGYGYGYYDDEERCSSASRLVKKLWKNKFRAN